MRRFRQFTDEVDEAPDIRVSDRRILDAIQLSPQFCAAYGGRGITALPPMRRYHRLHRRQYRGGTDRRKATPATAMVRRGIGHALALFDVQQFVRHSEDLALPRGLDDPQTDQYTPRRIRFDKDRYAAIDIKLKAILVDLERSGLPSPASSTSSRRRCRSCRPRPTRPKVRRRLLFDHLK